MTELKAIELKGTKIKEIILLARLFWCTFHISATFKNKDTEKEETISEDLRFIEMEKKVDRFTTMDEIILEGPSQEESLIKLSKVEDAPFKISFQIQEESYYFFSSLKDIFVLCEKIPAISFNWPETILKEQNRLAQRIKNFLPTKLEEDAFYIKDISVRGLSFFYTGDLGFKEGQLLNKIQLSIPLIKKKETKLETTYYKISSPITITRSALYKEKLIIYGTKFNNLTPAQFLLIRHYINIRNREETFFEKNQYYPKLTLPPMLFTI